MSLFLQMSPVNHYLKCVAQNSFEHRKGWRVSEKCRSKRNEGQKTLPDDQIFCLPAPLNLNFKCTETGYKDIISMTMFKFVRLELTENYQPFSTAPLTQQLSPIAGPELNVLFHHSGPSLPSLDKNKKRARSQCV